MTDRSKMMKRYADKMTPKRVAAIRSLNPRTLAGIEDIDRQIGRMMGQPPSPPSRIILSGISVRRGVGGRRGRKRRMAEERRAGGTWIRLPKAGTWKGLAMSYLFKRFAVVDPKF